MYKKILFIGLVICSLALVGFSTNTLAQTIPYISDADNTYVQYPIRENALVLVLQPVPDNSGDYTMTICNRESHCRQTSMRYDELRYIGLYLEDTIPALTSELNKKYNLKEWQDRQTAFRDDYANYMNAYDNRMGVLEALNSKNPVSQNKFTPRFKEGQSDKEICFRNTGSWACLQDSAHSKYIANIMKNGGCLTSVPDMGLMYRDWKYCQTTNEEINVVFLPNGETKIINDVGLNFNTLSDEEYEAELREYYKQNKK